MSNFVHLHVHSHYSLLNGLAKPKALVKAAKKQGFSALALTDYGSMYGAIEFYQACLENEIKPIIGFEAYIAPRKLTDKDPEQDKELYRLILLAENFEGYQNLMRMSSIGHLDGFFNGKPRIDKDLLRKMGSGVIALSGPIQGEIPQLILKDKMDDVRRVIAEYVDIFGANNFFLELQDHPGIQGQLQVNTALIGLAKECNVGLVVTRDVHYLNPDDAEAQDILRCISEGWKVEYTNREDYRQVDRSLNLGGDIISRFRHVPEAIENTLKIAERVNIQIPLNVWHFAPIEVPAGKTYDEHLRDEAYRCVGNFYNPVTDEIIQRL